MPLSLFEKGRCTHVRTELDRAKMEVREKRERRRDHSERRGDEVKRKKRVA